MRQEADDGGPAERFRGLGFRGLGGLGGLGFREEFRVSVLGVSGWGVRGLRIRVMIRVKGLRTLTHTHTRIQSFSLSLSLSFVVLTF